MRKRREGGRGKVKPKKVYGSRIKVRKRNEMVEERRDAVMKCRRGRRGMTRDELRKKRRRKGQSEVQEYVWQ